MNITTLVQESHKTAIEKGWWDSTDRNIPELIALIHSEVSEALESYRETGIEHLGKVCHQIDTGKPEGFTIELADVIIRIADLCGKYDLDIESALIEKMSYNKTRPYRHGNKVV